MGWENEARNLESINNKQVQSMDFQYEEQLQREDEQEGALDNPPRAIRRIAPAESGTVLGMEVHLPPNLCEEQSVHDLAYARTSYMTCSPVINPVTNRPCVGSEPSLCRGLID